MTPSLISPLPRPYPYECIQSLPQGNIITKVCYKHLSANEMWTCSISVIYPSSPVIGQRSIYMFHILYPIFTFVKKPCYPRRNICEIYQIKLFCEDCYCFLLCLKVINKTDFKDYEKLSQFCLHFPLFPALVNDKDDINEFPSK